MDEPPYYGAYDARYRCVYAAGGRRWGLSPDDSHLRETLLQWVERHGLVGKRVIEYACGEGGPGRILAELGCEYLGVDLSPAALETARTTLASHPKASVTRLDMIRERVDGLFDAALDAMGLHMLVTDADRAAYLANAHASLKPGAPMLFYHECYRENADERPVASLADWERLSGKDYRTPQCFTLNEDPATEFHMPILPARPRSAAGYRREMETAGFIVDGIAEIKPGWASIYTRKPFDP